MTGAGLTSSPPRASATSASTRSPSGTTEALGTCDNHVDLQERRQGDRRAGGHVAHLHGEVRRARGQLLPHPPVVPRHRRLAGDGRRRGPRVRPERRRPSTSSPGSSRTCASSPCCSRRTSTPTSGTRRARSRRRRSSGVGTTAPARCGSSGTGRRCGWRTGCPAATSTRTSRSPAMVAAGLRRDRARAGARAGLRRQRVRLRRRARARPLREALELWEGSELARGDVRRRRRRRTTSTWRGSSSHAFDSAVTDWERFRGFERM